MKTLIAITGPDGAGKDTIIQSLLKPRVRAVSIWDSMKDPQFRKHFPLSPEQIDQYLQSLSSPARALFLSHAIRQSLSIAMADSNVDTLILNGYWMKYFACESVYGADEEFLMNIAQTFPRPLKTIYLDLPVEVARSRKSKISGYESGFVDESRRHEHFLDFQTQVHHSLRRWQSKLHWTLINANQSPEEITRQTRSQIHDLLP